LVVIKGPSLAGQFKFYWGHAWGRHANAQLAAKPKEIKGLIETQTRTVVDFKAARGKSNVRTWRFGNELRGGLTSASV
jgi:hypothetical protein